MEVGGGGEAENGRGTEEVRGDEEEKAGGGRSGGKGGVDGRWEEVQGERGRRWEEVEEAVGGWREGGGRSSSDVSSDSLVMGSSAGT